MSSHLVATPAHHYQAIVERGILRRAAEFLPPRAGKIFVLTTEDVWRLHGEKLAAQFPHHLLIFPGGEARKRMSAVEDLAEQMAAAGGDRSSVLVAFGGGIVNDVGGFLAAVFMRGIPVIQAPTTLLAQVDAGVGGKTGVNLVAGKNLIGTFHQPLAVLIDPAALDTLPEREYRAGLYEVIKAGVIRSDALFWFLSHHREEVLAREPEAVDRIIAESVRIKADVVAADEREGDLRRILNYGHTFGHALEAETCYTRLLHGEAVAFGMRAAVFLAEMSGYLSAEDSLDILDCIRDYGPIPPLAGVSAERLFARLASDKKTVKGRVHFVLPTRIGDARVVSDLEPMAVLAAIQAALA